MLGNTRRLAIKSSSISEAPAQSTPAMGKKAATTAKVTMILRMVFQITPGFQWLLAGLTSCLVSIVNHCRKGGVMKPKAIKLLALAMTLGAGFLTSVISLGTLSLSVQR